jgi:very-short-patch-repair endonuclease
MANKRARELRRTMNAPERKLWRALSNRNAGGLRFRRQHPIGIYIADFICLERRLVVEVDGGQHGDDAQIAHDTRRTEWLNAEGYRVLRFWANEVMSNSEGVVLAIVEAAMISSPLRGGRRNATGLDGLSQESAKTKKVQLSLMAFQMGVMGRALFSGHPHLMRQG